MNFEELNKQILNLYATAIRNMAPIKSEYDKQKLKEQACRMGLVKWTDRQRLKVGAVGFLTGVTPLGKIIIPMLAGDIAYLMAVAGRGCYGVGHILNRSVDYDRDIPLILAIWSGAAHAATGATVDQASLHFANPMIVQLGANAAVGASGAIVQGLLGQSASKIIEMIMPKVLAKIGAQLAAKLVSGIVPVAGGVVSFVINRWICAGLMHAAEQFYMAEFVVMEAQTT